MKLIKRLFCKHEFQVAKFPCVIELKNKQKLTWYAPCTDIRGVTLYECKRCGKKVVKL